MKSIKLEKKEMNAQNMNKNNEYKKNKNKQHETFNFLALKNDNLQFIQEFESKRKIFQKKFCDSIAKFKNKAKCSMVKE